MNLNKLYISSTIKLLTPPTFIAIIPIIIVLLLELWAENYHVQELKHSFELLTKQTEKQTLIIDQELLASNKQFQECNNDFFQYLRKLESKYPAVIDVYILNKNAEVICTKEKLPIDISSVEFNTDSSEPQVMRFNDMIIYSLYDQQKKVFTAWIISVKYVWAFSRLLDHGEYWLERLYKQQPILISNQHHYQKQSDNDFFVKHRSNFQQKSYHSKYNNDIQINLYYKGMNLTSLGVMAKIRLLIVSLSALFIACIYYRKIQKNLVTQIKFAVINNEFSANFQPIVNLTNNHWVGGEALIRWHKNNKIYKYPDQFIPFAENNNLAHYFHDICTDNCIQLLKHLAPLPETFFISINFSPNDLNAAQILQITKQLKSEVLTKHFEAEITERGISESKLTEFTKLVGLLATQGIKVSLDDFGTGQSGLSYINSLHFDKIKIDKRFVQAINTDTIDFHILTTIIELATKLNVSLVAEGIETEQQKQWLIEHGVILGQGWLFSRDLSEEQFIKQYYAKKLDS
ncbi:MAG: EAL domain-containing protein [Alteromonadales bacterium]|nr:EAL domain-containing protein [Alteromonadales bacterium]